MNNLYKKIIKKSFKVGGEARSWGGGFSVMAMKILLETGL